MESIHVDIPCCGSYRKVLVDPDGTVWAYDVIAGHYSLHHDLTDSEIDQAREAARHHAARGERGAAERVEDPE